MGATQAQLSSSVLAVSETAHHVSRNSAFLVIIIHYASNDRCMRPTGCLVRPFSSLACSRCCSSLAQT